jgi:hypothetical protein
MKVNVNGYHSLDTSIIVHIERQKAWSLWPPKQPYSEFLNIDKSTDNDIKETDNVNIEVFDYYNFSPSDKTKISFCLTRYIKDVNNLYKRLIKVDQSFNNNDGYIFSFLVIVSMYGHSYEFINLIHQSVSQRLKSYIDSFLVILKSIDYKI